MRSMTVIIHGWSDCSESFKQIKSLLVKNGLGPAETILYADYESRENDLTYNDTVDALHQAFIERGIIDANGKALVDLNVIVHSTGGLVIRHWISWFYGQRDGMADCPVRRIIMLAPANFGSPLAHRGKSYLGSLVKGRWKVGDLLEVGDRFLEGLELGSPFQWWLAHQDLIRTKPLYSAQSIQVTVLVGIQDYDGLRGWVNKPGTDGTVVIAGTSINSVKLVLDFCHPSPGKAYSWSKMRPPDEFGFGVLEGYDHGTIVNAAGQAGTPVSDLLLRALRTTNAREFGGIVQELKATTATTYANANLPELDAGRRKPLYQQLIVHAVDDFGVSIPDFTLDFYALRAKRKEGTVARDNRLTDKERYWSETFNRIFMGQIHAHSVDPSYRRLLINVAELKDMAQRAHWDMGEDVVVGLRIYVAPVTRNIEYDLDCMQNIVIYDPASPVGEYTFLYENTTTLVELRVNRVSNNHVVVGTDSRSH